MSEPGIHIHVDEAPSGWDEEVAAVDGSVFHSSHWAGYQRATQGCEPVYLRLAGEGGATTGVALLLYRESTKPLLSQIVRGAELAAHPRARGDEPVSAAELLGACEDYARRRGCARLHLGSNFSSSSPLRLAERGYSESARIEFEVDLERDEEDLWQGIKKDQRDRIRKLERKGIELAQGQDLGALRGLQMVRETTQERREQRGQCYSSDADDRFYELLYEHLLTPGVARLFVARQGGATIAAILFTAFAGKAYSVFSGSTPEGYKLGAQGGLFWLAARTFKAEGLRLLNRGGVPGSAAEEGDPLHGIYRFKHRLGTTPVSCTSGTVVLGRVRDYLVGLQHRLRQGIAARS